MLNALYRFKGVKVSQAKLAEEASHIEIDILKKPMGKQDQYAAAIGGINLFIFNDNDTVSIKPIHLNSISMQRMFDSMISFWTGVSRPSEMVLEEQEKKNTTSQSNINLLLSMRSQTEELQTSGVYDLLEGKRGTSTLRNENNTKKVFCYWYIDLFDRENLNLLYEEYETSDLIVTSDFVTDFSKYDCEPDYVVTENTKESKFYQNIFKMIRGGEPLRSISDTVSNVDFKISHTQIGEMKKIVEL